MAVKIARLIKNKTYEWLLSKVYAKMSVLDVHTGELIHRSQLDPEQHDNNQEQTNMTDMLGDT